MTIKVLKPGVQTTVQAAPRSGLRHLGVPASGAADPLSLALANRLVGNESLAPGLEISLWGAAFRFERDTFIGLTGAKARAEINGRRVALHRTLAVAAGDKLAIGPAGAGARSYVAVAGAIDAGAVLGSASTYLPAGLGGFEGRALARGDVLKTGPIDREPPLVETPQDFRPRATTARALRSCFGAEAGLLDEASRVALFDTNFSVGRRADRMGLLLEGARFEIASEGRRPSAAVFPGTIQCPEDGRPFLLGVDAQTTGGYPRVAQVARVDRHLIGQLRPGDHVRLLWRDPQSATDDLRNKIGYWSRWLTDAEQIL